MGEFTDKAKGRIKQAVGSLTGDKGLKREGEDDERKGRIEGAVKDVNHAVEDAKHAVKEVLKWQLTVHHIDGTGCGVRPDDVHVVS
jgi:uncharacterized protein YjbJ (UPF0337 family)